jgi:tetratricopeptide (TPR) repeat protein
MTAGLESPIVFKKMFMCRMAVVFCFIASAVQASGDCVAMVERSEFDSARTCFQKALAKKPTDQGLQLANAKLMASASAARTVYKKLIAAPSCPDSIRAEAYYYLACNSYMTGNYPRAEQYCKGVYDIDRKDLYRNMYARCAMLNKHDSLSRSLLKDSLSHEILKDGDTMREEAIAEKNAFKQAFYLQVGAFGEIENAQALRVEIKRFCADVAVVAAISNEKNIFRVRVGEFDSKESAQAFGDSALTKRNISFRIVEE